jgi:hypothetical protein
VTLTATRDGPSLSTRSATQAVTVTTTDTRGVPYGPFSLWSSATTVKWGPAPFTVSQNATDPNANAILTQIDSAKAKHQKLVLAMAAGPKSDYQTGGNFDLGKWKARMNQFNVSSIKTAIAAGVSDSVIVGNSLIDEPEHHDWGTGLSKTVLNQMATYAKTYFPTLPMGVNHGPTGFRWKPTERYTTVDYVVNQYNWWMKSGNVAAWRDSVLAVADLNGVAPAFSLNILDGGVQDRDGTYDCTGAGQGGIGTLVENETCRMTDTQVRDWGRALGVWGCMMLMWKFDSVFMNKPANQQAFADVASTLGGAQATTCRRPA